MKHIALFPLLTLGLLLSACNDTSKTSSTDTVPIASLPASTEGSATENDKKASETSAAAQPALTEPGKIPDGYTELEPLVAAPVREFSEMPAAELPAGDLYALFDTPRGQVLIDLYEDKTPVTVNNFVQLARNRYYDGTRFHRVMDGFMAQGGDPLSADLGKKEQWGTGGPGYTFGDEIRQELTFSEPNLLAMANSGPSTNGSQFFITFEPTEFLNGRHAIFGKVASGEETLAKLTRTAESGGMSEQAIEGAEADELMRVRILSKN